MFYSSVRSGEEYSRWDSGPVDQVCFTVVSGVGRSIVGGIVDLLIRYVLQ